MGAISDKQLSRDMTLVRDVIGEELVAKLITELGGMCIYIPRAGKDVIIDKLKANAFDVKKVAAITHVSQRKVYEILRQYRQERADSAKQLSLFPLEDYITK